MPLYLLDWRYQQWCYCKASKSNFSLLWPWPLTSWPLRLTVHALVPVTICANLFIQFIVYWRTLLRENIQATRTRQLCLCFVVHVVVQSMRMLQRLSRANHRVFVLCGVCHSPVYENASATKSRQSQKKKDGSANSAPSQTAPASVSHWFSNSLNLN